MRLTGSNIITNVFKMFRQNCPLYILNVDQHLWGNAVQATFELRGVLQKVSYNCSILSLLETSYVVKDPILDRVWTSDLL